MDGTRQSLLNEIINWVPNKSGQENVLQRNAYWPYGSPGIGKTSLAHSICASLHERNHNSTLTRSLFDDPQKYGDERERRLYATRYDAGMSIPPSMNPLPTNSRLLAMIPRPSTVRMHLYFIAYERAVHPLMAFQLWEQRVYGINLLMTWLGDCD